MSNKVITSSVAKEFVDKAKTKNFTIYTKDYEDAKNSEIAALFPTFGNLSMDGWMQANCTSYATVTEPPHDFYIEAATHVVTSLKNAFAGCAALTSIKQIETRKVTDFTGMFDGCTSLPAVLEFVFQCDSITDISQVAGMFTNSSVKVARLENMEDSIAAKLILDITKLGDLDAAVINGFYIKKKVTTS